VSSQRPERVGEAVRDELAELIARQVHDPGVGFLTLTKVKVSPDLQLARVYYTSMGDEKALTETAKALKRATPFLRRQLGQRIRLRRVPELEFFYDASIAQHDRIEQILQELKAEESDRAKLSGAGSESEGAPASEPGDPPSRVALGLDDAERARPERSELRRASAAEGARRGAGAPADPEGGVPASERAGGAGGAKPPGQT
jgi:ribosome-binding factor A